VVGCPSSALQCKGHSPDAIEDIRSILTFTVSPARGNPSSPSDG
jgi:hypothetical protein